MAPRSFYLKSNQIKHLSKFGDSQWSMKCEPKGDKFLSDKICVLVVYVK